MASSSTLSVQYCPGTPGITPEAAHTLQGEAVPVGCQGHTEHTDHSPRLISHSTNNVHTFPLPTNKSISPEARIQKYNFL